MVGGGGGGGVGGDCEVEANLPLSHPLSAAPTSNESVSNFALHDSELEIGGCGVGS